MKITYNIEKKENGYSILFEAVDIPKLDNGTPDLKEYKKIWNIILDQVTSAVDLLKDVEE